MSVKEISAGSHDGLKCPMDIEKSLRTYPPRKKNINHRLPSVYVCEEERETQRKWLAAVNIEPQNLKSSTLLKKKKNTKTTTRIHLDMGKCTYYSNSVLAMCGEYHENRERERERLLSNLPNFLFMCALLFVLEQHFT